MILDRGILRLCRTPDDAGRSGDMMSANLVECHAGWYGERTGGMVVFSAVKSSTTRLNRLTRALTEL
mgnify:CR=1 FL=1